MSFLTFLLGSGVAAAGYYGIKRKNKNLNFSSCIYDKLLVPSNMFLNKQNIKDSLKVLAINHDYIEVNTLHKTLYAIELSGNDTIEQPLSENMLDTLYEFASKTPKGYFYQAILKDKNYQKQYLFSYSKDLLEIISKSLDIKLLKGKEIVDVLFDLFLDNSFYIKNKQIHRQLNIGEDTTVSYLPVEQTFNKVIKNNMYQNLSSIDIYNGYKIKQSKQKINYNALYELDFNGVIWAYYDFNKDRSLFMAQNLLETTKLYGGKDPFVQYLDNIEKVTEKVITVNFEIAAKDLSNSTLNKISEILSVSFTKKKNRINTSILKTPLKFRDTRFDMPANISYLNERITSVHKKASKDPDFFGEDTKKSHVNFSFASDNDNPHSLIIAPTGSGKSVAKQKILSQMIEIDFDSGYAPKLGLESHKYGIRNFDIGESDRPIFNLISKCEKNNIGEIKGKLKDFSFNLLNFETDLNGEPIVEDIQFSSDLISMILESQNKDTLGQSAGLTIQEVGKFKEIVKYIYKTKEFQQFKIRKLRHKFLPLYNELLNLGYQDGDKLIDIKEEKYNHLKVPLLNDVIKIANIRKTNQQISNKEREGYSNLYEKLSDVESLEYFSEYDNLKISETAYIYAELNNIKESSLFVPMFFGIFWKSYIKDRERALNFKKQGRVLPKLIYVIEEASNYFRFKTFQVMFEKLVYEARKYNIHMMFIIQNIEEVPYTIFKNINTRIFLFPPDQKEDLISYIGTEFKAPKKVLTTMQKVKQYNLVIWYNKGVINMSLIYKNKEIEYFTTNPNKIKKQVSN